MQYHIRNFEYEEERFQEEIVTKIDELMGLYLADKNITTQEYEAAIQRKVLEAQIYPIYHGSALKDLGVETLMHAAVHWLTPDACNDDNQYYVESQHFVKSQGHGKSQLQTPNWDQVKHLDAREEELSAYVYKVEWQNMAIRNLM